MTREEKAKAYDKAYERAKNVLETVLHESGVWAIKKIFPELKESEDERIRKELLAVINDLVLPDEQKTAWSDEDKAIVTCIACYLDGQFISEGARKQCQEWFNRYRRDFLNQPKNEWSDEDEEMLNSCISSIEESKENRYAYKENDGDTSYDREIAWLKSLRPKHHKEIYQAAKHDLAIKFINYLDNNKPEGKMCLSNGECEDIDKAFKENDWAKIIRYAEKYQIQSEQKPEVKLTGWVARDENKEIWVYGNYPEKKF